MKIAVDFDGTIVENKYPKIGKPKLFAFETLKKLQNEGYLLILWTYRHGQKLKDPKDGSGRRFYSQPKPYLGKKYMLLESADNGPALRPEHVRDLFQTA